MLVGWGRDFELDVGFGACHGTQIFPNSGLRWRELFTEECFFWGGDSETTVVLLLKFPIVRFE